MKHEKNLWNDVSKLVVAVLAVMAFLRGNIQSIALAVVFLSWSAIMLYRRFRPFIKEYLASGEVKQLREHFKQRLQQNDNEQCEETESVSDVLLHHAEHRISAYLQAIYPDAAWSWCDSSPATIVSNGGTARIALNGVPDFEFAEVVFDRNANIDFKLLNVVPLNNKKNDNKQSEESNARSDAEELNPQIWYEEKGKSVLSNLIEELNSRGHSSLTIEENGDIVIKQGDRTVRKTVFDSLPDKSVWTNLAKVIESGGIATEVTESGLVLSW